MFLRKRAPGEPANHADPDWLDTGPLAIEGVEVPINRYFLNHPEMVLGTWSRKDRLYGGEAATASLGNGDLAEQLDARHPAAARACPARQPSPARPKPAPAFTPPPPERHIAEGSFFVGDDRIICQVEGGQGVPVTYGGTLLKADGTMTGKRLAALVGLRDLARRVLQSQNEGWPEANRNDARRDLNRAYDLFVSRLRPDQQDHLQRNRRRHGHPPHAQPGEIPRRPGRHAGHGAGRLRRGDRQGGQGRRSCCRDVVGKSPPVTSVASAEEGLLVSLDRTGGIDLPYIAAALRQARGGRSSPSWAT